MPFSGGRGRRTTPLASARLTAVRTASHVLSIPLIRSAFAIVVSSVRAARPKDTLLEATAHVAVLALGAAYPEMHDLDDDTDAIELRAAVAILDAARNLGENIHRYRLALALLRERDELLPF